MSKQKEQRNIFFDVDLGIEVYQLCGIVQKFPKHFHDYYVIGFVEKGNRHLWCKGKEYDLSACDVVLFNPAEAHYCTPITGEPFNYYAVNIKRTDMKSVTGNLCGRGELPQFQKTVIRESILVEELKDLYNEIWLRRTGKKKKEEFYHRLLNHILQDYAIFHREEENGLKWIENLCDYMKKHSEEAISLKRLSELSGFSKSYLIQEFKDNIGDSPYRYLQNLRLEQAKGLLEKGMAPVNVGGMTGFSDQSHFTHVFKNYLGVTPKQYQRIYTKASIIDGGI